MSWPEIVAFGLVNIIFFALGYLVRRILFGKETPTAANLEPVPPIRKARLTPSRLFQCLTPRRTGPLKVMTPSEMREAEERENIRKFREAQ